MKFKEVIEITEANENLDNGTKIATKLETELKKLFPNSYVDVKFSNRIYPSISGVFTLGKNKSEWEGGIPNNDPARTSFIIDGFDKEGNLLKDKIKFDSSNGFFVYTKPPEGSNLAMGKERLSVRKKTATPDKIVKHTVDSFTNFKKLIKSVKNNMMDHHLKLIGKNIK